MEKKSHFINLDLNFWFHPILVHTLTNFVILTLNYEKYCNFNPLMNYQLYVRDLKF